MLIEEVGSISLFHIWVIRAVDCVFYKPTTAQVFKTCSVHGDYLALCYNMYSVALIFIHDSS